MGWKTDSWMIRTVELGLGTGQPKSTTKPTRHQPLIGIDVFEYVFDRIVLTIC